MELDDGSHPVARYGYDGSSWWIENQTYAGGVLSETRHFYHSSAWRVLEERVGTDPTSAPAERQYVWGDRYLDELVERDRDADGNSSNGLEERLYALQDANFDVTAIADSSGKPSRLVPATISQYPVIKPLQNTPGASTPCLAPAAIRSRSSAAE